MAFWKRKFSHNHHCKCDENVHKLSHKILEVLLPSIEFEVQLNITKNFIFRELAFCHFYFKCLDISQTHRQISRQLPQLFSDSYFNKMCFCVIPKIAPHEVLTV